MQRILEYQGATAITSTLSRLECRVKPVRLRDAPLVARYDAFFGKDDLELIDLERNIVDRATALRTQLGISTPDALHMASALEHHAEVFLTGDADLSRCHDIQLEVLTKP